MDQSTYQRKISMIISYKISYHIYHIDSMTSLWRVSVYCKVFQLFDAKWRCFGIHGNFERYSRYFEWARPKRIFNHVTFRSNNSSVDWFFNWPLLQRFFEIACKWQFYAIISIFPGWNQFSADRSNRHIYVSARLKTRFCFLYFHCINSK